MSTISFKPVAAEPVDEQNGLIHGVSAQELQIIGGQAIDAKAKAYCTYDLCLLKVHYTYTLVQARTLSFA
jgi:cytidine deaminase